MEIPVATNVFWLTELWPELAEFQDRTAILYAGRNSDSVLHLSRLELINHINEQLVNGKDILVLDNSHETLIPSELDKIYDILSDLNTTPDNVYYLTNSSDAICNHDILCERNNWSNPINIVVLNNFEYVARHFANVSHAEPYAPGPRQRKFLCMNRMPHLHRTCMLGLMLENNLVGQAFYSFYDTEVCVSDSTSYNIRRRLSAPLAARILSQVNNYHSSLPLRLTLDADASNPIGLTAIDAAMFDNSYFSVIPETYFFKDSFLNEMNTVFMTEKTYHAILMKHPFIIAGMPNTLDHLHHNGYRTFHPYIDESYDDILDDEQRLLFIMNEINRLCSLTDDELMQWQHNIKSIVDHNYQVLMNRHPGPLNSVTLRKNNNERT
jgi:hypothetical protein